MRTVSYCHSLQFTTCFHAQNSIRKANSTNQISIDNCCCVFFDPERLTAAIHSHYPSSQTHWKLIHALFYTHYASTSYLAQVHRSRGGWAPNVWLLSELSSPSDLNIVRSFYMKAQLSVTLEISWMKNVMNHLHVYLWHKCEKSCAKQAVLLHSWDK